MGFVCRSNGKLLGLFPCGSDKGRFFAISSIGLDIFYQGFVFDIRTVTGNLNPTVDGTYETIMHTGGATFRINF
jgi:long-chain fatty acid transport protein